MTASDAAAGRPGFDLDTHYRRDIPPDVAADVATHDRQPADLPFTQPCTFDAWPDVRCASSAAATIACFRWSSSDRRTPSVSASIDRHPRRALGALSRPRELAAALADAARLRP